MRRLPTILWLILAVALALRLFGAWRGNLIFDERAHLALAQTIDLRPDSFHLVSRSLDHPLLSVYVLRLSGLLFGDSDFGLRILHVLAGTVTVVPIYFLGKRVFGETAGLGAAALLAIDQFHASWSRAFMPEVLMLLFGTLVLLQLLRVLPTDRTGGWVLLGVLLGAAYLAKEPAILLIPVVWVFLVITPEYRRQLRRPGWYLAQGVFLLVIAPDVIWNLTLAEESYLYRDAALITEPYHLSMKSFSLYLGEWFQRFGGEDLLGDGYAVGNIYACMPAAGVLYLGSVAAAFRHRRRPAVRLMLVCFSLVFVVFLVLPGGEPFEPFWWASLSWIPAVVCAGRVLHEVGAGSKVSRAAVFVLLGVLCVQYVFVAWRPGLKEPRATVDEFANFFLNEADDLIERGKLHDAERILIYVLNISGPNAEAYYGLGRLAHRSAQPEKAKGLLEKCLRLDPGHRGAVELLERLEQPVEEIGWVEERSPTLQRADVPYVGLRSSTHPTIHPCRFLTGG